MKPMLLALASMAMLMLGGCASMSTASNYAHEVDSAQVAAIEAAARQSGVQVHWLNYPRKKTSQ